MPEAVDSNSTVAPKIHVEFPPGSLPGLAAILHAHKLMLDLFIEYIDRQTDLCSQKPLCAKAGHKQYRAGR